MSDTPVDRIYGALQKLISLHRELMECVRSEREALTQADLKKTHDLTCQKEALIHSIRQVEMERIRAIDQLVMLWKTEAAGLTLNQIILRVQDINPKQSEQMRSAYQALVLIVKRIQEQNEFNRGLVEKSLVHVAQMKQNILGEASPKSEVYNQSGNKSRSSGSPRLISKEV